MLLPATLRGNMLFKGALRGTVSIEVGFSCPRLPERYACEKVESLKRNDKRNFF